MTKLILDYLNELFPNPRCELDYSKDYELLISVMLSAQTTDKRVNMVTNILYNKYSTLNDLMNADVNDIINIIKPIGTFNKKSKNIILIASSLVNDCNGVVPNDREYLESLPGVGRKTANVVLANLFNEPCIAVDTHIARVSKRLNIADNEDDVYMIEKKLNEKFAKDELAKLHLRLVLFGRYYCKALKPLCHNCKLKSICSYKNESTKK